MRWRRRRRRSSAARFAQWIFLLTGLALLSYTAYMYSSGFIYQKYMSWKFDRALANLSRPAPPIPPSVTPAPSLTPTPPSMVLPIERIEIPRLGIADMVREGDDDRTLSLAVGHIPSTALPGRLGNVGLAAHRDTLFRNLKDVRVGDEITLTTLSGKYVYRVAWFKIVPPTEVSVLDPSPNQETLTLVTCYPFYYIGHAPKRFIVRAERLEPTPAS